MSSLDNQRMKEGRGCESVNKSKVKEDFPVAQVVKNLPVIQETRVQSLGWEDPLEKGMQSTPVFLPGDFSGQRCLAGYSSWCRKESHMTE